MSPLPAAVRFANPMQQLVNSINRIVGPQNMRALFIPHPSDGQVSQDRAVPSRVWTHSGSPAGRYGRQGDLWTLSFDGATQYLTTPDADDLSFGNGTTDSPFSIFVVGNVTDTANSRLFFSKYNSTLGEYFFGLTTTDIMRLLLRDESVIATPHGDTNAAVNMGSMCSYAATYGGGGGATAADGIVLYQNGAAAALAAATNAGTYVAMENLAPLGMIGAFQSDSPAGFYQGLLACVLLCATALTAAQVSQLDARVRQLGRF